MRPDRVGPQRREPAPRRWCARGVGPAARPPRHGRAILVRPTFARATPALAPAPAALTLVEMVLVVAITALISAIALPRYANSIARYRAESAARRVAADLALAQNSASTTGRPQSIVFVARGYQMPGLAHLDGKVYGDYTV